jgi:hypothetical protein
MMHRIGDRVLCIHCPSGPWYGRVLAIECLCCGRDLVDGRCGLGHDTGPLAHLDGRMGYTLIVAQENVPGDMRPWCIPENFPRVGRSAWEHVLEDPLVRD